MMLSRTYAVCRELVFRAWTEEKQLSAWWGPHRFTNPVCEMDLRPGGRIRIDMRAPDGAVFRMGGCFHEISSPERLVFTSTAFEDEEGRIELENLNTVLFYEQQEKTLVIVQAAVVRSSPDADAALGGVEEGWRQSLDKLADFLERNI